MCLVWLGNLGRNVEQRHNFEQFIHFYMLLVLNCQCSCVSPPMADIKTPNKWKTPPLAHDTSPLTLKLYATTHLNLLAFQNPPPPPLTIFLMRPQQDRKKRDKNRVGGRVMDRFISFKVKLLVLERGVPPTFILMGGGRGGGGGFFT